MTPADASTIELSSLLTTASQVGAARQDSRPVANTEIGTEVLPLALVVTVVAEASPVKEKFVVVRVSVTLRATRAPVVSYAFTMTLDVIGLPA
jgi:hypothetical protein